MKDDFPPNFAAPYHEQDVDPSKNYNWAWPNTDREPPPPPAPPTAVPPPATPPAAVTPPPAPPPTPSPPARPPEINPPPDLFLRYGPPPAASPPPPVVNTPHAPQPAAPPPFVPDSIEPSHANVAPPPAPTAPPDMPNARPVPAPPAPPPKLPPPKRKPSEVPWPPSSAKGKDAASAAADAERDKQALRTAGVTAQEVVDYATLAHGDVMSKYGFWRYWAIQRASRQLPDDVLARILPAQDATLYLHPSGRIATNEDEQANRVREAQPPATATGSAFGLAARALGGSEETVKKWTQLGDAIGGIAPIVGAGAGYARQRAERAKALEEEPATPKLLPPKPEPKGLLGPAPQPKGLLMPKPDPTPGSEYASSIGELAERDGLRLVPGAMALPPKAGGFDGVAGGDRPVPTIVRGTRGSDFYVVEQHIKGGNWIQIQRTERATPDAVAGAVRAKLPKLYQFEFGTSTRTPPVDPVPIYDGFKLRVVKDGPADAITLVILVPGPLTPQQEKDLQSAAESAVRNTRTYDYGSLPNFRVVVGESKYSAPAAQ